jgi:hypothetical protein
MTQAELEQIAKGVRAKGLRSSWSELIEFSDGVVGGLVDAYQALLRNPTSLGNTSSSNPEDVQQIVQDRLARALTLLTSQAQVARWKSEVLGSGYTVPEGETSFSDHIE